MSPFQLGPTALLVVISPGTGSLADLSGPALGRTR